MTGLTNYKKIVELAENEYRGCAGLPFAVFLISREGIILKYNEEGRALLGLASEPTFQDNLTGFYMNPNDRSRNLNRLYQLNKGEWLKDTTIDLKIDGEVKYVRDYTKAIWDEQDNSIVGLLCLMTNISQEAIYFNLVNNVPTGLYKIRINSKGEHCLVHCNRHFANHRGVENPEELIGKDIRSFHKSMDDFNRFHNMLIQKDREGQYLLDYILEAYNGKGELRKYEVHSKLLKDARGNIMGRVGAERDVTDYWETKQQLEELTTDIGKVLHSYSSTLIHSKHTMDAVIRSFAVADESWKNDQIDEEKVFEKIIQKIVSLEHSMEKVLEKNKIISALDEGTEKQLTRIIGLLKTQKSGQIDIQQVAIIRDGSIRIKEMINDIASGNFPRELLKDLKRKLQEILRLCSLVTLNRGIEAVLEMETVVNNLRSFILTRVREKEELQRLDIYDILIGVVKKMGEYAAYRNVELRLNVRNIKNAYINGYENDLVRALLNVLHNAVKYSWARRDTSNVFVKIEGRIDNQWLYLTFENWGVPITTAELEEGLIFKVGYRGINSSDRRRPGTGLGLYDSLKVIEKHNGIINISSEPSLGNRADDYTHPFITKVTIQLPNQL